MIEDDFRVVRSELDDPLPKRVDVVERLRGPPPIHRVEMQEDKQELMSEDLDHLGLADRSPENDLESRRNDSRVSDGGPSPIGRPARMRTAKSWYMRRMFGSALFCKSSTSPDSAELITIPPRLRPDTREERLAPRGE